MLPYGFLQIGGYLLAAAAVALLAHNPCRVDVALDVRSGIRSQFIEMVQAFGGVGNLVELKVKIIVETVCRNGNFLKREFSLIHLVGTCHELGLHHHCHRNFADENDSFKIVLLVEFLAEPYSHGLSSLANPDSFAADVKKQAAKIEELFGKKPTVLRNSSLIYSDDIGAQVASMGFKGMLTEGAKHVLGWKSPHYVYHCNQAPNLKLLLRDIELSDDISLRFNNSEWEGYPLFADAYIDRIARLPEEEQIINIFMELSALGIAQPLSSNILEFLKALPAQAKAKGITFSTPTEICKACKSVSQLDVPDALSWVDEERDASCWLGNAMQREAFTKLYSVADRLRIANDPRLNQDWDYLQASNNFRFMTTKPSNVGLDRGIYSGPFDAFTNYMNILGDFINRVNALYPLDIDNDELEGLLTTIKNQGDEIEMKDKEITRLKARIEKMEGNEKKSKAAKPKAEKKPAAKKAPAKKAEAKK